MERRERVLSSKPHPSSRINQFPDQLIPSADPECGPELVFALCGQREPRNANHRSRLKEHEHHSGRRSNRTIQPVRPVSRSPDESGLVSPRGFTGHPRQSCRLGQASLRILCGSQCPRRVVWLAFQPFDEPNTCCGGDDSTRRSKHSQFGIWLYEMDVEQRHPPHRTLHLNRGLSPQKSVSTRSNLRQNPNSASRSVKRS